jgi:O-antigen/teichoic acid export membrane protein
MMRGPSRIISIFLKNEEDRERLHKVVIPTFIIHFFAGILLLVFTFVLTRGLGSKQYGLYRYSFSIVYLIVNLATYAICITAVRESPSLLSKGKIALLEGLHQWSLKLILLTCTLLAIVAAIFITTTTFCFHLFKETAYTTPLLLALITVPLCGVMNYFSSALRGRYKIVLSLLPDNIIKPLILLSSIGILFIFSIPFNIRSAILLNIISFGGAGIFAITVFYKTSKHNNIQAEYDTLFWEKSVKTLFLLSLVMSINSRLDILMLGYLKDPSQVGIYSAADRVGTLLITFLLIMNQISAASISRLHSLEQKQQLQGIITKASRWVMLISLPVYIFIVIFSKWIMALFGPGFEDGQTALIIIATGQIINIAFGPVGNIALMTGNQRFNITFTSINIFVNIILNLILTPKLGITGTAIATAFTLVIWNTGMFLTIRKKTGIATWIFG